MTKKWGDTMPTLSRTAEQCRKCPNVRNCNNKRMEACAMIEAEKHKLINNASAPLTNSIGNPSSVTVTPITIHMGEYGNTNTTMENIKEQLEKQLRINACSFNK